MNNKKKKIVFMGTPEYARVVLSGLIEQNYNVILVVSQPDKKVGRKQILTPSVTKQLALKHNIEVFQPLKIKENYQKIVDLKPDLIITAAYGQIVPKQILECAKFGCINLHGSILPKYRGGAPIQWAIINSEKQTGVTLMYMDEKMDTGDIIKIATVDILENENLGDIFNKMAICAKELLLEQIDSIFSRTNERTPQNDELATYSPNITKSDEEIDIKHKTAQQIHDHVRGLYPFVIANIKVNNQTYKLHVTKVSTEKFDVKAKIGEFIKINKKVYLPTIDNKFVEIITIQKAGKKPISGRDFANQLP